MKYEKPNANPPLTGQAEEKVMHHFYWIKLPISVHPGDLAIQ